MNPAIEKITILAMVRAIPDLALGELKPGRLKNLYHTLTKAVDYELASLPRPTGREIGQIESVIQEFGKKTGWHNTPRHMVTLLSFCLALIEYSSFTFDRRIHETLVNIMNFFEQGGDIKYPCFWAGDVAFKKWKEIVGAA